MQYSRKDKMPIEKSKVRDLLRNQHIYRGKINSEISTFSDVTEDTQWENGVVTYINEAA